MKKKLLRILLPCIIGILLAACGNDKEGAVVTGTYYYPDSALTTDTEMVEPEEETVQASTVSTDMYLIISNDMTRENMILEQLASGKQYMYYYSLTTSFLDKYGNHTTVFEFEPGRVIRISDKVWEYPDITRYSIDEERGVFQIADSNYSFDEDLFVVSDGEQMKLSSIKDLDEIKVVGVGKKILSVSVTTGHGEIRLENTAVFDGSYIQIGNKIFAEVTSNMTMDVPEGTYLVTVANNGYGGSTEVVVERNQTTVVNLEELKGEGPKTGKILFAIDVADAKLRIDGKEVDYSQALDLQYGIHSIIVNADGYDAYSKKLFVNSEEATILIELTDSDTVTTSDTAENQTSGNTQSETGNTSADTNTNTNIGTNTGTDANTSTDSTSSDTGTTDYLSTLSELLSTIVE